MDGMVVATLGTITACTRLIMNSLRCHGDRSHVRVGCFGPAAWWIGLTCSGGCRKHKVCCIYKDVGRFQWHGLGTLNLLTRSDGLVKVSNRIDTYRPRPRRR